MIQLVTLFEARGKREEIYRVALAEKFKHHIKDDAMLFGIEGIRTHNINDVMHAFGFQHDGAEECFLRLNILRGYAEIAVRRIGHARYYNLTRIRVSNIRPTFFTDLRKG